MRGRFSVRPRNDPSYFGGEHPFIQIGDLPPVDQLFSLADQIEARYAKSKQYVYSLKQSILAKAFRGELVPQNPNDDPTTVLLERIREARASQPANRSRRRVKLR
jgi:type I restriction enzyme, S subunit